MTFQFHSMAVLSKKTKEIKNPPSTTMKTVILCRAGCVVCFFICNLNQGHMRHFKRMSVTPQSTPDNPV